jgi:hypothetical protein
MSDRTVHAEKQVCEIVRYDRAGKWYIEPFSGRRRRVGVRSAATEAATASGMRVHFGLRGGAAFDRAVRRALDSLNVPPG